MPSLYYENLHGRKDGKVICGVDEVGRGPLAGPVMAAAVVLPPEIKKAMRGHIRDSKKMTPEAREEIFPVLVGSCRYCVAEASVEEISRLNIFWASMLAMRRAVEGLKLQIDLALVDGNHAPDLPCPAKPIVAGDDKCLSIAAASIIAKVTRDRFMKKLAEAHPGYGWETNVGYATKEHLAALHRLGITVWHRDSFAPVSQLSFAMD